MKTAYSEEKEMSVLFYYCFICYYLLDKRILKSLTSTIVNRFYVFREYDISTHLHRICTRSNLLKDSEL